jgi:hypothetical protein
MQQSANPRRSDVFDPTRVPSASALSKIGTLDFLTVLPSGIFIFVVTYMVGSGNPLPGNEVSLWLRIEQLITDTLGNPLILLCVLFVSYFFGIILRAFPVEWLVANLHVGRRRCPRRRATDKTPGENRKIQFRVRRGRVLTPRKPDIIPKSIIDGWKHALSNSSPEAYAYFRTVEAKSRFAAAMLWAGVLGVLGSGAYIAVAGSSLALTQLALISTLLTVVFGSQLPKVCRQEVTALLTLSEATRQSSRR